MRVASYYVLSAVLLCSAASAWAADDRLAKPCVGEVMALAIDPNNAKAAVELHHDGWLAAQGQLLSASQFPELFEAVGRTWTADGVREDRFAIPNIHDRAQRIVSSDNPFGVLGPGDLVTGGRVRKSWLSCPPIDTEGTIGTPAAIAVRT